MSSDGSDIELQSALPKKIKKKIPKSPSEEMLKKNQEAKKITTRDMINQALSDLKTRKGTSLYAIKKYIEEKYKVDIDKLNYIIKKSIKTGVETGTIVQTKGVGATGSFKLAAKKERAEKKEKQKKNMKKSVKSSEKSTEKADKPKKLKESKEKNKVQKPKKKMENVKSGESGEKKERSKKVNEKPPSNEAKIKKSKTTKMAKGLQTPAKNKAAMMKRKSIGSIIKPPKMKPRKG